MKKLLITLSLLATLAGNAQCPSGNCNEVPMTFDYSGNGSSLNNKWTVSYGSPTVGPGYIWLWSYNNRGEGVNYSGYSFVAGRKYCISYTLNTKTQTLATPNTNAQFNMVLTQSTVTGNVTNSNGAAIPTPPAGSQQIVNTLWSTFPNNAPNDVTNALNTNTYSQTFTANTNFNNLWIYPSSPTLPQVEVLLSNITICDITEPPCNSNFDFLVSVKSTGEKTVTVTPNSNTTGYTYNFTVYRNGTNIYSGTNTNLPLTQGGNYKICAKAYNGNSKCETCYEFCLENKKDTPYIIDNLNKKAISKKLIIDQKMLNSE